MPIFLPAGECLSDPAVLDKQRWCQDKGKNAVTIKEAGEDLLGNPRCSGSREQELGSAETAFIE